jgi:hypothetical protein
MASRVFSIYFINKVREALAFGMKVSSVKADMSAMSKMGDTKIAYSTGPRIEP